MTRAWLLVGLLACKSKESPAPKVDDTKPTIVVDLNKCGDALDRAATAPLDARPQIVIDGCQVCGDWKPILRWNHEGTTPESLQKALEGCDAFCTGDAKMKFIAAANKAKNTSNDMPWRRLAETCPAIDASSDHRFMSAPYFALDRVARAVGKARSLDLPLPPLTIAGTGIVMPDVDNVSPKIGALHISLIGEQMFIGKLPRAKLGAKGLEVTNDYPGQQVTLAELPAALKKLVDGDPTETVTLLAPFAMPAENLVPVIQSAGAIAPLYLAATAHESPEGWQLPAAIPVALGPDAEAAIDVTGEMSVQNLATELSKKAAQDSKRVGVVKR